jgi:hypothetical protein
MSTDIAAQVLRWASQDAELLRWLPSTKRSDATESLAVFALIVR